MRILRNGGCSRMHSFAIDLKKNNLGQGPRDCLSCVAVSLYTIQFRINGQLNTSVHRITTPLVKAHVQGRKVIWYQRLTFNSIYRLYLYYIMLINRKYSISIFYRGKCSATTITLPGM